MDKNEVKAFFDARAAHWDEMLCCDDEKMNEILSAAGVKAGDRVLDIACGTGVMFPYYYAAGVSAITGVDISPEMLRVARKKYSEASTELLCADASAYAFERKYHVCIVFNAFPHFADPAALLKNLYGALLSGGTLTVAHDRGRAEIDRCHEGGASHISNGLISAEDLSALMKNAGFTPLYTKETDGIYIVTARV